MKQNQSAQAIFILSPQMCPIARSQRKALSWYLMCSVQFEKTTLRRCTRQKTTASKNESPEPPILRRSPVKTPTSRIFQKSRTNPESSESRGSIKSYRDQERGWSRMEGQAWVQHGCCASTHMRCLALTFRRLTKND